MRPEIRKRDGVRVEQNDLFELVGLEVRQLRDFVAITPITEAFEFVRRTSKL
jgi:hypothetical protein